jgi:hypothetical protein
MSKPKKGDIVSCASITKFEVLDVVSKNGFNYYRLKNLTTNGIVYPVDELDLDIR